MDGEATASAAGETASTAQDFAAEFARNPAAVSAATEHPGGVEREAGIAGRSDSSRGGATLCRLFQVGGAGLEALVKREDLLPDARGSVGYPRRR